MRLARLLTYGSPLCHAVIATVPFTPMARVRQVFIYLTWQGSGGDLSSLELSLSYMTREQARIHQAGKLTEGLLA